MNQIQEKLQLTECVHLGDKEVGIICATLILCITLVTAFYCVQTYKLRKWNPIQELSPLLTIFQALSLYFFIVSVLLLIFTNNYSDSLPVDILINFLALLQNYCRGFFIVLSVSKSMRVTFAFELNLKNYPSLCMVFKSQRRILLLSSILVGVFWTGLFKMISSFIEHNHQYNTTQKIVVYENLNATSALNNTIEFCTSCYIIYVNSKLNTLQFRALQRFITRPLMLYCLWLFLNTFLNYLIPKGCNDGDDKLPEAYLIMMVSQTLRCTAEFYFFIIEPLSSAKLVRNPFYPSQLLKNFEQFIRIPICAKVFYKFLKEQTAQQQQKLATINKSVSHDFLDLQKVCDLWIKITTSLENGQNQLSFSAQYFDTINKWGPRETELDLSQTDELRLRLLDQLQEQYMEFQRTNSWQTLETLFKQFDLGNENFYRLRIIDFFVK